jgi:hypothetical protein
MVFDEQVSVWDWPFTVLPTQYGTLTYREWCEKEIQRLAVTGDEAQILDGDGIHTGMISIFKKISGGTTRS